METKTIKNIEIEFSERVKELLNKGYWVNVETMNMFGNETTKIDLTNGETVVRVLLREYPVETVGNWYFHCIEIKEVEFQCGKVSHWDDKGKLINEHKYYDIGSNVYTDSVEKVTKIANIRFERMWRNRRLHFKHINYQDDVILKILKNHKGYKRIKRDQIIDVCRAYNGDSKDCYIIYVAEKKPLYVYF